MFTDKEVSIFLRQTLSTEKLSDHAESCRKKLLQKLDFRESSPHSYIDMNGPTKGTNNVMNIQSQISECYEEVDRITPPDKDRRCSEPITLMANNMMSSNNSKSNLAINNTYNNIETVLSEMFLNKEIRPEIPTKKSTTERNSLPNSVINSNRNSVSSFKKDSPDRISTSSSIVADTVANLLSSSSTSSMKSGDDNSEVLTMSASAVRYSAVKYGTLLRKEKFLFVDVMKQYWTALLGQVIYVYISEKDNKPCLEINVTGYQARPVEIRDSNKKDCSFEIFSPGKRTYQFTAQTSVEMEHWISVICQAGKVPEVIETTEPVVISKEPVRQLPSIPSDLMYDRPDSAVRPVNGDNKHHQLYEMMQEPEEEFYHYIEHDTPTRNTKDKEPVANESSLYKNINVPLKGCIQEDNMYYNLIPCPDVEEDKDEECFYDVINEKLHHVPDRTSPVSPTTTVTIDNTKTSTAVQYETRKLPPTPANPAPAMSSRSVIIQDEIYELVN